MTTIITIIFMLQLSTSCNKEKALTPYPSQPTPKKNINENFTKIWDVKNTKGFTCAATVVTQNEVIYWVRNHGTGFNYSMISFNKNNGDTLWHKSIGVTDKHKLIGNYVYYDLNERLICMDPSTGNEIWRFSPAYLSDYIYANGSIYAFFYTRDSAMLYKINPFTGSNLKLYTIKTLDRDGYMQSPNGMAYWKHPNGNDIIFTQSNGLKVSVEKNEFFAIDITADSMYWDLGNYFSTVASGHTPLIKNNTVFVDAGWGKNASLNLVTKTLNWNVTEPFASQTGGRYAVLKNNKIFKEVGNYGHFNVLSATNGTQLATHTNIGTNFYGSPLRLYNNKIYFSTSKIIGIIDCNSNNLIQKIEYDEYIGDNQGGGAASGLDVDQTNGYIYTTRGYDFVCIKEK